HHQYTTPLFYRDRGNNQNNYFAVIYDHTQAIDARVLPLHDPLPTVDRVDIRHQSVEGAVSADQGLDVVAGDLRPHTLVPPVDRVVIRHHIVKGVVCAYQVLYVVSVDINPHTLVPTVDLEFVR